MPEELKCDGKESIVVDVDVKTNWSSNQQKLDEEFEKLLEAEIIKNVKCGKCEKQYSFCFPVWDEVNPTPQSSLNGIFGKPGRPRRLVFKGRVKVWCECISFLEWF